MATKKKSKRNGVGGKLKDPKLIARFGKNVRDRREGLELSQAELAGKVRCSRINVSNIETGKQGVTLVMFVALCGALECTPDVMLAGAC